MADPKHILFLNEIADLNSSDGYPIEVIETTPGTGVIAAKVGTTEKHIIDAVLRADIASCHGIPYFIYFLDGGFSDITIVDNSGCPITVQPPYSSPITFTYNITTEGSTITLVEFFVDGVKDGEASLLGLPTVTYDWTPPADGIYDIRIKVTNDQGQSAWTPVCKVYAAADTAIAWIDPLTDLTQDVALGYTFIWALDVADATGGKDAAKVEFFLDGVKYRNAVWTDTNKWALTLALETAGVALMKARGTDGWGRVVETSELTLTITSASAPVVTWDSPTSNTTMATDSSLVLTWSVTPDTGRTIVQFDVRRDLVVVGQATDNGDGTWSYTFNSTSTEKVYQFSGEAIDELDNKGLSSFIDITVAVPVAVSYALRWHGAGVADQSFAENEVLQYQNQGMLDGNAGNHGISGGVFGATVASGKYSVPVGNTGNAERSMLRDTVNRYPFNIGLAMVALKHRRSSASAYSYVGSAYVSSQVSQCSLNYDNATPSNLRWIRNGWTTFTADKKTISNIATEIDMALVLGGFNPATQEPWDGVAAGHEGGAFMFTRLNGGDWILEYAVAKRETDETRALHPFVGVRKHVSSTENVDVESFFVPGETLESMLVPLVMDTFNRADGPLGGSTSDSGHVWEEASGEWVITSNQANRLTGAVAQSFALIESGSSDVIVRANITADSQAKQGGIAARAIDNLNVWYTTEDSTVISLISRNAGGRSVEASTTRTYVIGNPHVLIADGDEITVVHNDLTVISTISTLHQTATKAGLKYRTAGAGSTSDNFSVYLRKSTTQYDDAIQPYINNLEVVAPSTPAAPPLYLLEADFSVLPNSAVLNDGDPVPGIQTGSLTARQQVPGSDEPYQIISGTLRTTGDRDSWVESNSIGELVAGRAYITAMQKADDNTPVSTNRFVDAPYGGRFSTAQIGSSVSNSAGSTGSRVGHLQVGNSTAGISFTRNPNVRLNSQHAMVAGDFLNGEPGAGAEGVLGFEKMENDSQWLLGYVAATGNETPADQAFIIRGGSAGTDQRTVYAVVPYKPLTSVIAPKAADTFTRADAVPLNAELSEIGGIAWENLSNGGTGLTSMVHASNKVIASTGGLQTCHLDVGMADVVARVELYINGTPNAAPGLSLRTVHAHNTWSLSVNPNSNLIHIYEWNSGTPTSRASATPTTIHTDNTTPNIIVGAADGPDITMILNDNDVISYPTATFQQTETKHGLFTYATGDQSHDNFSVYPRRSYSQYDDTLDPYVPGYTAPALIVHDEFTGNNGDNCEGRLPDTVDNGNNWFVCANDPPNTNVEIDNNRATAKNNTTTHRGLRLDTGVTDYIIEARCTSLDSTSHQSGVVFAAESGTGVNGGHYFGTLNDDIIYRPNGIQSTTDAVTFSSATFDTNDYLVRVVKIGKTAEMLIDGVLIHSAILSDTDAGHTHAGAGLRRADIDSCQWIKMWAL